MKIDKEGIIEYISAVLPKHLFLERKKLIVYHLEYDWEYGNGEIAPYSWAHINFNDGLFWITFIGHGGTCSFKDLFKDKYNEVYEFIKLRFGVNIDAHYDKIQARKFDGNDRPVGSKY